jgi:hypothetical protein
MEGILAEANGMQIRAIRKAFLAEGSRTIGSFPSCLATVNSISMFVLEEVE